MGKISFKIIATALTVAALSMVGGCGSDTTTTTPGNTNIFNASSVFLNGTTAKGAGYNGFGQFGDGTTNSRTAVTAIARPAKFNGMQVGAYHSLAFGTYSAWTAGGNTYGQLGRVTSTTQDTAFQPVNFASVGSSLITPFHKKIIAVAAGGTHNLLLNETGEVWAWGANGSGQLGNGTYAGSTNSSVGMTLVIDALVGQALKLTTPLAPTDATLLAAGAYHSLALIKGTGTVYAWGLNNHGQLGIPGFASQAKAQPVTFPVELGSATITKVAAGGSMSAALDSAGNVWIWGIRGVGQTDILTPVKVAITGVADIAVGLAHVVVRKNDNSVWTWGFNGFGQLGNNSKVDSFTPVQVIYQNDPVNNPASFVALTGVTDIRAVGNHSFAKAGSTWYGWGDNTHGQLGGSTAPLSYALVAKEIPAF